MLFHRSTRLFPALLITALIALALATSAHADRLYWSNFDGPDPIAFAELGGSGVSAINTGTATTKLPYGVAIDQTGGRIYWANSTGDKISYANLDGSGGGDLNTGSATLELPSGIGIDPVARKIYWANADADKISWANLDGSGGADLDTTGATVHSPGALTVDPTTGRVYWTNESLHGSIASANLGGGGGANLPISGTATLEYPLGLAIDQAAQKIYWTNDTAKQISVADLDGSNSHNINTSGASVSEPYGLAVDPEAHRVYWGNTTAESISFARYDETGGASLPLAIPKGSSPGFPVLLKTPRNTSPPSLFRAMVNEDGKNPAPPEAHLTCTQGTWAGDLVESFLYRAPLSVSLQWTREGQDVSNATGANFAASGVGEYRCRVTANNWAGSSAQLSPVAAVFGVGKAKLSKRQGTARLPVNLPAAAGSLTVAGKGIAGKVLTTAGPVSVLIRPTGRARKALARKGSAKVGTNLTFTPAEGPPVTQVAKIILRKKTGRR